MVPEEVTSTQYPLSGVNRYMICSEPKRLAHFRQVVCCRDASHVPGREADRVAGGLSGER
jgi:hypothetical protein